MSRKTLSILVPCLSGLIILAGLTSFNTHPKGYFRLPIDFVPSLSGSFGEFRTNHFHSGLDFRTQGVEGKPIYASADGYVSRIRISPVGFGKAIYLDHPNGYTTVYAHVRNFPKKIQQYIRNEQYRRESFDVDLYPEKGLLPVKKGEIIAWSGNSGTSGGPHLHYEIRKTDGQIPVDPALFGLNINDKIAPVIQEIKIYPMGDGSHVNGIPRAQVFPCQANGNSYIIAPGNELKLAGRIAFGIRAYDRHDDSELKLGFQGIEININKQPIYSYHIHQFAFDNTRYVNAVLDFDEWITKKRRFLQTRKKPNNPLDFIRYGSSNGIFAFSKDSVYVVEISVLDSHGNKSSLRFKAKGAASSEVTDSPTTQGTLFRYNSENRFESENTQVIIPQNALYEDIWLTFSEEPAVKGVISPVRRIHQPSTPVHLPYTLRFRLDEQFRPIRQKICIVQKNSNITWSYVGGKPDDDWITATSREFGEFSLAVDSIPPVIKPINIADGKNVSPQKTIQINITDNLSGISGYKGTINGRWILMDYDAKNNLLVYEFDDRLPRGKSIFRLDVSDNCGNSAKYEASIVY